MIIQALSSMVTILAVIALGYLLQAKGWFKEGFSKSIADLILKIALPSSIFVSVLKFITREQLVSFFGISLYPLITVILGYLVAWGAVVLFKVPVGRRGVMLNTFVNANTVFMGLPLNLSLFGEEAMPYFLVYYVINTLSIFTVGMYFVSIDRPDGNKNSGIQWKSLFSPPLIAFLVALSIVVLGIPIPTFAKNSINMVGSLVTPLSLMYIGINLQQSGLGTIRLDRDTVIALAGRFIIFPLLMVLILLIGGTDNTLLKETFIIQSTIPTIVIMPILAAEATGDVDFATNMVTMTTIAYLAVLPLWSLFLFFI